MTRTVARVGCTLVLLPLAACRTEVVDVRAEDRDVLSTDARLSWELEAGEAAEDRTEPRVSIELDVSHGSGEDALELGPTQGVSVGGLLLTGGDLYADFDLTRVLLDARIASQPRSHFSFEGFAGLEYSELAYTVRPAAPASSPSASGELSSLGPAVGAALVWQPIEWLRCSTEGRVSLGFAADPFAVSQAALDVGVGLFPWRGLGAYFGWRSLDYSALREANLGSDVHVRLAGPVVALRFRF